MSLKKRNHLIRVGALIAASALALTGCSSNDSGDSKTDGSGTTTVTISTWYQEKEFGPALTKANEILAKDNIKLESTQIALDQYNTWLSTQLASGSGPDLVMDGASFPARVAAGNLVEVTDREVLSNYNEAGLALAKDQDGKIFGAPTYGWFSGYFYNKDLFKKHGVEVPKTFDEFVAAGKKFKDAGVTPVAFGLQDGDKGLHSLMGFMENAYYHNGDGSPEIDTKFAHDKAKLAGNWNKSIDKWKTLIKEGIITPDQLGVAESQASDEFVAGNAAMIISGPWDYTKFKDAGLNIGVFSHVGANADEQWLLGGPAANFGVNKDSKNQEAALKAFDVLASKEVQQAFLEGNPGAFSYSGVTADLPEEYALVADILAEGRVGVAWDRWGVNMPAQAMVDETIKQIQSLIGGQLSTEEFVKSLDSFAQTIRY